MNNLTKTTVFIILFFLLNPLSANETPVDSVDSYLNAVYSLVKNKDSYKEDFLDIEFLLDKARKKCWPY